MRADASTMPAASSAAPEALSGFASAVKRAPRIALFGQFGAGNLGNEASLEAMIRTIRAQIPQAAMTVICSRPDVVSSTFGLPAIDWMPPGIRSSALALVNRIFLKVPYKSVAPLRCAAALRGFDMLLVPGTGLLDDFGERAAGGPFAILSWMLGARLAGCGVMMASIGAGPIRSRLSRSLMIGAARLAQEMSFRDEASRDFIRHHMRTRRDLPVYPDLAFSFDAPPRVAGAEDRTLALGVMRYRGWTNDDGGVYAGYIEKLACFGRQAIDEGWTLRLVIGEAGDEEAVQGFRVALGAKGGERMIARTHYSSARNIHDVIAQMSGARLAVATRFHNVVGALIAGTPVISLSYGAKNDILLDHMGLGAFTAHVETFDPEWLTERVKILSAERDTRAVVIRQRVAEYRTALEEQAARLGRLVNRRANERRLAG